MSDWIASDQDDLLFIEDSLLVQSFIETSDYVVKYKLLRDTLFIYTRDEKGDYSSPTSRNLVWEFRVLSVDSSYLSLVRLFPKPVDTIEFKKLYSVKKNDIKILNLDLSTSACFGFCPVIDLKIFPDSTMYQYGYWHTIHSGLNKFHLNPIDYDRIQRKLNSIDPDSLSFRHPGPDAQYYQLHIKSNEDSIQIDGNLDFENYKMKAFIFYMLHLDELKKFMPVNNENVKFRFDDNSIRYIEK
jgi:hypothetical protein